jgi:hypothetical protein
MRERYRMYQRKGGMFYAKDRKTGQRLSLNTTDKADAKRLLAAKNQATEQPYMNVSMAKVYLSAQSPEFLTRTWGVVLDHLAQSYEGATAVRWRKFAISDPLKLLVNLPLYQTEAVHFLAVLNHHRAGVSTNVWLRILHNGGFGPKLNTRPVAASPSKNMPRLSSLRKWTTTGSFSVSFGRPVAVKRISTCCNGEEMLWYHRIQGSL